MLRQNECGVNTKETSLQVLIILLLPMLIGHCLCDEAGLMWGGVSKKGWAGQELGRAHRDPIGVHNPANLSKNYTI